MNTFVYKYLIYVCMHECVYIFFVSHCSVSLSVGTGSECLQLRQEENVHLDQRHQHRRVYGHVQRFDERQKFYLVLYTLCMYV